MYFRSRLTKAKPRYFYSEICQTTILQTQGKSVSSTLKGLCGVPQDEDVPDRWLPDGESASNEAEFLNGYELTGLTECQFEQEVSVTAICFL